MRLVFLLARFSFNAELRRKTSGIQDFYTVIKNANMHVGSREIVPVADGVGDSFTHR